jgi:DNA-binding CsgD family transcriptional regulator
MAHDLQIRAQSAVFDAAADPALWPAALASVAQALGVAGVGCAIRQPDRGAAWISMAGLGNEHAGEYTAYYSARDPWGGILDTSPILMPLRLSSALSSDFLSSNEWYNEYARRLGIVDILGVPLDRTPTSSTLFAIHSGTKELPEQNDPVLRSLCETLSRALKIHREMNDMGWRAAVAGSSLDQMTSGVLLVGGDCRVVEINRTAATIIEAGDGIFLRAGRLSGHRACDTERLTKAILAAVRDGQASRMTISRAKGNLPFVLRVSPLTVEASGYNRPMVLVLIAGADQHLPSVPALREFFGLSPAEARITAGLMEGKQLAEVARECAIRISTARTQLSSVLRKVGVRRQSDLLRVLATVRLVETSREGDGAELPGH